jgi:twitching motility protein PilT
LTDINWSDLCVSADPNNGWFKEAPDSWKAAPIPPAFWAEMKMLFIALDTLWMDQGAQESRHGSPTIIWPPGNGIRLRAKRMPLANGTHVYVCRAYRFKPRAFKDTGMARALQAWLMSRHLRGGIGIFLGRPGAGKTTTACSYLQERARVLGGVTWTIESPVELDLEGRYGDGYIHQREVDTPELLAEAVQDVARATPNALFVGEVLDERTAEVVVQASKMGFLVLCTYHGGDLVNGIERFARAAGRGAISQQFVDAFRFAIHIDLRLADTGGDAKEKEKEVADSVIGSMQTGNPPRVLATSSLFLLKDEDPTRDMMRNGVFGQLRSEIERQRNVLQMHQSKLGGG